ncbi:hypothetical protein HID58_029048 [Brassica napus]|uniref:Uncharacterized protein n=1 Tax=Brassica napus TaxID=3708 RepID=A0ABQ8CCW9_BRANA|nr:hypothetical protein HID58_029048 [Brassica napus]
MSPYIPMARQRQDNGLLGDSIITWFPSIPCIYVAPISIFSSENSEVDDDRLNKTLWPIT